jgi:CubicO group peptidase (beta-lactamase class C family)
MKRWILAFFLCCCQALAQPVSDQLLDSFSAEVESERLRWQIPSIAVGYVEQGRLRWFHGYGQKSVADPNPPDADTVYNIGSASKAFGALTLAMAVDQGKVAWDDRLCERDPHFAMACPWVTREFRLFDLFAQHPGVNAYALSIPLSLGYSPEHLMAAWRHVPPSGHFRSTFAYVNIPHLFAGRLLADLYQQPDWEAVVDTLVLRPLGMQRTSGRQDVLRWPNRAPGHVLVDGKVRQTESGTFPFNAGPAGSLSSSVNDLTKWIAFQCGDGQPLLSQSNLLRTRLPQTQVQADTAYAMGWGVAYRRPTPLVWHTGGTLTHACIVAFEPEHNRGLIVLTNLGGQNLAQPLAYRFFDLLHGLDGENPLEAAWQVRQASPAAGPAVAHRPAAAPFAELSGRYDSPALGPLLVSDEGKGRLETIGLDVALQPVTGDTFRLTTSDPLWVGLGAGELFLIQFQRDTEGRVTGGRALQEGGGGLDAELIRR